MNNDFLGYIGLYSGNSLQHSAKGTTWKNHKYIKKENGRYYYPGDKTGSNKAKRIEWQKNDPDFNDANYDDKNRLGDTDFFGFTRPDGTFVILEEDVKWEIPNGKSVDRDRLSKSLEKFGNYVSSIRDSGKRYTSEEWERDAEKAINSASMKVSKDDLKKALTRGRK